MLKVLLAALSLQVSNLLLDCSVFVNLGILLPWGLCCLGDCVALSLQTLMHLDLELYVCVCLIDQI